MKILFAVSVVFVGLIVSCTGDSKSPALVRLERDVASMEKNEKDISARLKIETDIGTKHDLTQQESLLKSRIERAKIHLEEESRR